MIGALLISASLTVTAASPASGNEDAAAAFIKDATGWLLNGDDLPEGLDARLQALEPSERLRAIIFLRRSGLYSGTGWTIERVLAPALSSETGP
ncbi:hypothetical protein RGQ15_05045 [Paracoccus sp. MBLB3053]|uniref:Uncharacterized protein n=1 Tax=Paracoccus aurantius TaxID=3073814 RepID=A0ABU2HQS8_9RHOB|nr:hypothetical protein [Paracoccus sp. MBLB3053]MDS9466944.1 hypothetical protein [Paracoccus sp. MBLB3053]